jgi:hypothetical protein
MNILLSAFIALFSVQSFAADASKDKPSDLKKFANRCVIAEHNSVLKGVSCFHEYGAAVVFIALKKKGEFYPLDDLCYRDMDAAVKKILKTTLCDQDPSDIPEIRKFEDRDTFDDGRSKLDPFGPL